MVDSFGFALQPVQPKIRQAAAIRQDTRFIYDHSFLRIKSTKDINKTGSDKRLKASLFFRKKGSSGVFF